MEVPFLDIPGWAAGAGNVPLFWKRRLAAWRWARAGAGDSPESGEGLLLAPLPFLYPYSPYSLV